MITTTVWVTHEFVGWHAWPDAPERRDYLASLHRHLFHVRAELEVDHDDREVEFHDLLDIVQSEVLGLGAVSGFGRDLGAMSCEMIAVKVGEGIAAVYPGRRMNITVSEDEECGATIRSL